MFDLDVLACPRCAGRLGVIATVREHPWMVTVSIPLLLLSLALQVVAAVL